MARSTPISPVTDFERHRIPKDMIRNDEIVNDILSFLDNRNSSSSLYTPVMSSSRPALKSRSIKQWVESIPTSPRIIKQPFGSSPLLESPDTNEKSSASSSCSPSIFSPFSQIAASDEKAENAYSPGSSPATEPPKRKLPDLPVSSHYPIETNSKPSLESEPVTFSPVLPERNPIRLLAKNQAVLPFTLESSRKRVVSMPDLKGRGESCTKPPMSASIIAKVPPWAEQSREFQPQVLESILCEGELHFPSPPVDTGPLTYKTSSLERDSIGGDQSYSQKYSDVDVPTELPIPGTKASDLRFRCQPRIEDVKASNNVYHHRETSVVEVQKEKRARLSPHLPQISIFSRESSCHNRSHSYASLMPKTSISNQVYGRIFNTPLSPQAPLSAPILEGSLDGKNRMAARPWKIKRFLRDDTATLKRASQTKTEPTTEFVRRDAASSIRSERRPMKEKNELLDACRIIGPEARLLTVRRRSLSGTKINWLVEDNGMAIRGNVDCGRLLLRCFGESDGRLGRLLQVFFF